MEIKKKYWSIKSFKRRTIKSISIAVIIVGLLFIVYQVLMAKMIDEDDRERLSLFSRNVHNFGNVLKTRASEEELYFICNPSGFKILANFFDDDYCDCPDGSDEPQTNACPQANFVCHHRFKLVSLPSSRVNDGICDCCDGSDENEPVKSFTNLDVNLQKKLGIYLQPCPNVCPR